LSWLLDANALIALGWPPHQHHARMPACAAIDKSLSPGF
jgi:hypothetical protein